MDTTMPAYYYEEIYRTGKLFRTVFERGLQQICSPLTDGSLPILISTG
jgi:hypothetical protein